MNALPRCSRHPGARAGWRCRACQALLCPGCAFVRVVGTTEILSCSRCGEAADPLTARRSELASFAARLPRALLATFTGAGMLTLGATAAVMWLLGHLGLPGAVFRLGVFWGVFFAALRQASRGEPGVEAPDLSELFHDLVRPALLGVLSVAIVLVPAAAWLFTREGGWSAPVAGDPMLWLIAAASVLYVPMALIHAAMGGSALRMLNPVAIGGTAVRLGLDYVLAVGAVVVLVIVNVALTAAGAVAFGSIPVVSAMLLEFVGLLAPVMMARTLGLLLHVRGDAVGVGIPTDYQEPVLPGVAPRGSAPVRAAPAEGLAVERSEEGARTGAAARIEAIELEPPPAVPASTPAAPPGPERIAEEVQRGDLAAAARLFAALRAPAQGLTGPVLFQVARGAAGAGDYPLAVRALSMAARTGDPAVAPEALLVLGRIWLHHLNRPADARKALEHLLSRYPETAAAAHARQLLAQ